MNNKVALIIAFISGIILPTIAIIAPNISNKIFPTHNLNFEITNFLEIGSVDIFEIKIENLGTQAEKSVQVIIPKSKNAPDEKSVVKVDSSRKIEIAEEPHKYIFTIGDLKSQEVLAATFLVESPALYYSTYDKTINNIEITSEQRIAHQKNKDPIFDEFKGFMFWIFAIGIIIVICIGFYLEYLLSPAQKIAFLKNQNSSNNELIRKLRKKLES